MPPRRPLAERFWEKVDKNGPIMPGMDTPCWVWTAFTNDQGYGTIRNEAGQEPSMLLATTASWLLTNNGVPLPEGMCICHGCDNPPCVREDHFFLGTRLDNNQDRDQKGRQATGLRNGRHTHPEATARGDRHGFRLHPEAVPRGSARGRAKLDEEKVREILRRCKAGETSQSALAREFGVSSNLVSQVIRRKIWTHVEG